MIFEPSEISKVFPPLVVPFNLIAVVPLPIRFTKWGSFVATPLFVAIPAPPDIYWPAAPKPSTNLRFSVSPVKEARSVASS